VVLVPGIRVDWVEMVIIPAGVLLRKRTEAPMNQHDALLNFIIALVIGLLVGSFVEYTVHRLMHKGKFLGKRHAKHHRNLEAQGWWGEFTDYSLPGLFIAWAGFPVSIPAGIGFALGTIGYAAFAAYAHQVQHEKPDLTFWLGAPIHYLHHRENMWHHNFGIGVSIWDHILGTYRAAEWQPERPLRDYPIREFVSIRWR
jgi:sterol desaturase/sphingolipid hydroxylase (fatty acid hydroxylase superfamily)